MSKLRKIAYEKLLPNHNHFNSNTIDVGQLITDENDVQALLYLMAANMLKQEKLNEQDADTIKYVFFTNNNNLNLLIVIIQLQVMSVELFKYYESQYKSILSNMFN